MKKLFFQFGLMIVLAGFLFAQSPCSDGIDNDGDGLIDWQEDLGCIDSTDTSEGGMPSQSLENGWTVMEPSPDSKIYFVSSSEGSDNNDGLSASTSLKTIAAAYARARADHPDWILLKRGDVFYENITPQTGRSKSEPFVYASYGPSIERPMLKTGFTQGIAYPPGGTFRHLAIIGLKF